MDIRLWYELKETIKELNENGGTGSQKDITKFLLNYMDILEKQNAEGSYLDEDVF